LASTDRGADACDSASVEQLLNKRQFSS